MSTPHLAAGSARRARILSAVSTQLGNRGEFLGIDATGPRAGRTAVSVITSPPSGWRPTQLQARRSW